jgi:hypothetical protein
LMDKGKIEAWLMTKFNWILNNHRLDYRGPIVHTLWEDKSICLMSSSVITVLFEPGWVHSSPGRCTNQLVDFLWRGFTKWRHGEWCGITRLGHEYGQK